MLLIKDPVSAAITAGGSVLSTAIGAFTQAKQNEKNRQYDAQKTQAQMDFTDAQRLEQQKFATSEREAAQQWDLQMWNQNNMYNSPSAQLDRMTAAGINPNSAFPGLGSQTASQIQTHPQSASSGASAPSGGLPQQFDIGTLIQNGINATFQNTLIAQEAKGRAIENKNKQELIDLNKKQLDAQINAFTQKANLDKETAEQVKQLTPLLANKTKWEGRQIISAIQVAATSIQKMWKEIDVMDSQIDVNKSQEALNDATTGKVNAEKRGQIFENAKLELVAGLAEKGILVDEGTTAAVLSAMLSGNENLIVDLCNNIFSMMKNALPEIKLPEFPKWLNPKTWFNKN